MSPEIIHNLYLDSDTVIERLKCAGEISLAISTEATLTKVLVLSAASYFETAIQSLLIDFCNEITCEHPELCSLVKNRVISRQFHTYFDWEKSNANKFFAMFGEDFKRRVTADVDNDTALLNAIRNFMEIGSTRNQLVHLNFASCSINLTSKEIHGKFSSALTFVDYVRTKLLQCAKTVKAIENEKMAPADLHHRGSSSI